MWGIGVVQEIDGAALSLAVLSSPGMRLDTNGALAGGIQGDYDDFQYVKAGALINF